MTDQRKSFDHRRFIDREFEQELFEELLRFSDEARLLTIGDRGGMGKSQLLQMFQYRCRTGSHPRIPVSLVDIKQLPDLSPMAFVQAVVRDLSSFGVPFPTFEQHDTARRAGDFGTIRASVYLREVSFREARNITVAGVQATIERVETVQMVAGTLALTAEQQETAQAVCLRTFFADLDAYATANPVVILIDTYEQCHDPRLKPWLEATLLDKLCFDRDQRPARVAVVIAGRELPDLEHYYPPADCEQVVRSVAQLHRWSREHVQQCMQVHGMPVTDRYLNVFHGMAELGIPPSQIVQAIEAAERGATNVG